MAKIISQLMFSGDIEEAVGFYVKAFGGNSKITTIFAPSAEEKRVSFLLAGQEFEAITGKTIFSPAISFTVNCKNAEEVDRFWHYYLENGTIMMELGEYPFSKRFGWIADKYGLSWQIMLNEQSSQKIVPSLMFVGENYGLGEEAIQFYTAAFPHAKIESLERVEQDEAFDVAGTVRHAVFTLADQVFVLTENGYQHQFMMNNAISFVVYVEDKKEMEAYQKRLSLASKDGTKDKYGVHWIVVPM
jgi:predicted 3-demethylubiquinone-9 3-methyltransferase (glyoxalase superfamily)